MAEQLWSGAGASVFFSGAHPLDITSAFNVKTMSATAFELEALDDTNLNSTDYMEKVPGSLRDPQPIEIEVYWDYREPIPFSQMDIVDDFIWSMAYTDSGSGVQGGSFTAEGHIISVTMPELNATDRTVGTIVFQPNGKSILYSKEF